jgi:hypothetical protein
MKNLLLLTTFVCSVFFARAQFATGQKLISGQFGISLADNEINATPGIGSNNVFLNFSPSFAKFKSPTVLDGIGISYFYSRYHTGISSPATERIQPTHSIGVFVNRTKLEPLAKKFFFTYTGTIAANAAFSRDRYASGPRARDQDNYGVSLAGGIGLLYQLNQRFLLTWGLSNVVSLAYNYSIETSYTPANTPAYKIISNRIALEGNMVSFNLGNVSVGVKYMLKK